MSNKIIKILNDIGYHILKNISDYMLLIGLSLILRWIYVVKGFDSFILCLGMLLVGISLINGYSKK